MQNRIRRTAAITAASLAALAGQATAQDIQEWAVTFTVNEGPRTGDTFAGLLTYDQADLEANFLDGILFAEAGEFNFAVNVDGAVLDTNLDPFAIAFFGANDLIGLNFIGDNGTQAINTFDLPNDINNEFNLFDDPDLTVDGFGTFTFERITETDIITIALNAANSSIDDTDIVNTPTDGDQEDENTNFGDDLGVSVDDDDGPGDFNPRQILIRFNDLIGNGDNQMPLGSVVTNAVFRVEIDSPGSGFTAHQILVPWEEETATWNFFSNSSATDAEGNLLDGGLQPGDPSDPDSEIDETPDFMAENVGGTLLSIDLTRSVQNFANGDENFGFALLPLPGGTDGVDFFTSEAPEGVPANFFPPLLTVQLTDGRTLTFQENQNGYNGTADTTLSEAVPDVPFGSLNTTSIDLSDGGFVGQYLLRFDEIFGTGPDQINPATDSVINATITSFATSEGEDVALYELVTPFNEGQATWNSFGGGIDFDEGETNLATNPDEVVLPAVLIFDTQFDDDTFDNPIFEPNPETPGDGFVTIDVTSSLQKWTDDPDLNEGWAFLPLSTNGYDFDAEGTLLPPVGPQLFVSFVPPEGCNPADIAAPFGSLTGNDLSAFVQAFLAGSDAADVAEPFGALTGNDISQFVQSFLAGCPTP